MNMMELLFVIVMIAFVKDVHGIHVKKNVQKYVVVVQDNVVYIQKIVGIQYKLVIKIYKINFYQF